MLEIVRVLSQSTIPIQHSIVFLFNGAEENLLQVSLILRQFLYLNERLFLLGCLF